MRQCLLAFAVMIYACLSATARVAPPTEDKPSTFVDKAAAEYLNEHVSDFWGAETRKEILDAPFRFKVKTSNGFLLVVAAKDLTILADGSVRLTPHATLLLAPEIVPRTGNLKVVTLLVRHPAGSVLKLRKPIQALRELAWTIAASLTSPKTRMTFGRE